MIIFLFHFSEIILSLFQDDHPAGPDHLLPRPVLPDEDDDAPLHEQQQARPPHPTLCHELQVLLQKE